MLKIWCDHTFEFVCAIRPITYDTGTIREFNLRARYRNTRRLMPNAYGNGPFCKFSIPSNLQNPGVYALTADEEVIYVGECVNLTLRFNSGYGNISPRNCYAGGQLTNCRINHSIYAAAETRHQIDLWFLETRDRNAIESELIQALRPKWNRQGIVV